MEVILIQITSAILLISQQLWFPAEGQSTFPHRVESSSVVPTSSLPQPYPGPQLLLNPPVLPKAMPTPRTPGNSPTHRPLIFPQWLPSQSPAMPLVTISQHTTLVEVPCPTRCYISCQKPREAAYPKTDPSSSLLN